MCRCWVYRCQHLSLTTSFCCTPFVDKPCGGTRASIACTSSTSSSSCPIVCPFPCRSLPCVASSSNSRPAGSPTGALWWALTLWLSGGGLLSAMAIPPALEAGHCPALEAKRPRCVMGGGLGESPKGSAIVSRESRCSCMSCDPGKYRVAGGYHCSSQLLRPVLPALLTCEVTRPLNDPGPPPVVRGRLPSWWKGLRIAPWVLQSSWFSAAFHMLPLFSECGVPRPFDFLLLFSGKEQSRSQWILSRCCPAPVLGMTGLKEGDADFAGLRGPAPLMGPWGPA